MNIWPSVNAIIVLEPRDPSLLSLLATTTPPSGNFARMPHWSTLSFNQYFNQSKSVIEGSPMELRIIPKQGFSKDN